MPTSKLCGGIEAGGTKFTSPQRIVVGGGVMEKPILLPMVREQVQILLNKYVLAPEILEQIGGYIVPPGLGKHAGVLGAIALAQRMS